MTIWKRIIKLSPYQLWKLILFFVKRPLLIIPFFKATKQCLAVCNRLFKSNHHGRGKANAFRHVLWNFLICKKVMKFIKNDQKNVIFAQKSTFLYEKVTKNEKNDQFMDLHNNEIGRSLFLSKKDKKLQEIIDIIQKMMKNAQLLTKIEEFDAIKNQIVYLTED